MKVKTHLKVNAFVAVERRHPHPSLSRQGSSGGIHWHGCLSRFRPRPDASLARKSILR